MKTGSSVWRWIGVIGAAVAAVAAWGVSLFWRGRRIGEARGRGAEREKGVREAGEAGNVEELDDYWRGKR